MTASLGSAQVSEPTGTVVVEFDEPTLPIGTPPNARWTFRFSGYNSYGSNPPSEAQLLAMAERFKDWVDSQGDFTFASAKVEYGVGVKPVVFS